MADIICNSCNTSVFEKALFCYNCGQQLKCRTCQEPLVEGANNCIACGTAVVAGSLNSHNNSLHPSINIIKLRENKDERVYEIEFTNEVGKEIKEVVADLLRNKIGSSLNKPLILRESPDQPEELPDLPPLAELTATSALPLTPVSVTAETSPETEYPHLNDLDIKLNCKENEWLLIFAFYKSAYGTTTFTKEVVWQLYKEKRKTETRFKNLGTNWKSLFKKYISTVKENEFRFTPQGLTAVKSLLLSDHSGNKGNRGLRPASSGANNKTNALRSMPLSRKVLAASIAPAEFDVYKNDKKEGLESFFRRKKPGNGNPNRIVTIAYYITRVNHQEYFTEGNIDFAYRILNLTGKPVHLKQVITNLKNDRIWFQKVHDRGTSGWKLTQQAEIYVEEKLPLSA